jgi:predicted AlkP superfamily phosphohydrolase/phosphomutase/tetratricopeptide (TPR) repeat protein
MQIAMKKNKKVVVIGWDAAEWKIIDALIAKGLMPTMKKFLEEGVRGRLATLDPPLSPMLWTSMATGVRPYKHGILGFTEPSPTTGGIRPVSSKSRKVRAIWNIFTNQGIKSNVVGWWPSNPVEPIYGNMVSNLFQVEKKGTDYMDIHNWEMPNRTIHPESLTERLKELRVHPSEITGNLVMPFTPAAVELNKKEEKLLNVITKYLAHATSIHAAVTELMTIEDWDFTAVYHDAIDHFSHAFMKYHSPKLDWIEQEDYEMYKDVVTGTYIYHDMMLERMLKLCDEDTTVMICSDHGFHCDHLRPRFVPHVPSGPAIEHGPYGIIAVKGPGIKAGAQIFGASVLDITPTLLAIYDLPVGKNMDGKVLSDIFEHPKKVNFIESWETIEGNFGELSGDEKDDPIADEAAMQQLIDLGYIDAPTDVKGKHGKTPSQGVAIENSFYLAKSYISAFKYEEAIPILERISSEIETDFRYKIELINAYIKLKKIDESKVLIKKLKDNPAVSKSYFNILDAKISYLDNRPLDSIKSMNEALKEIPNAAVVYVELGKLFTTVRDLDKAMNCFDKALEIDKINVHAIHGKGVVHLRAGRYEDAVEMFLEAIEVLYHFPQAHLHLAESLMLLGEIKYAETAFEQVALMAPSLKKVYRWLLEIQKLTGNKEKEKQYQLICNEFTKGHINVISGLPSNELEKFIQIAKNEGINLSNSDDILNFPSHINMADYLSSTISNTVFLPLGFLGSLPLTYDYTIVLIDSNPIIAAEYVTKRDVNKKFSTVNIDTHHINSFEKQLNTIEIWFDQQPDLDIIRLNIKDENNLSNVIKLIKN